MSSNFSKPYLTSREAASYLGIKVQSVYNLVNTKAISYSKPNGGRLYFKIEDLDEYMERNKVCVLDGPEYDSRRITTE